jgi:drug/metabolite transporter (DMT)-like permease
LSLLIWLAADSSYRGKKLASNLGLPGWIIAFVMTSSNFAYIHALMHTSVSNVAVIYATIPFFVVVIVWIWFREKPALGIVAASLVCVAGVAIMVGKPVLKGNFLGDGLAFIMTLCMALITIIAQKYPNTPVVYATAVAAILSAIIAFPLAHNLLTLDGQTLFLLVCFGVLNIGGGFALYTYAARLISASHAALLGLLDVPLQPLLVYWFVNEIPRIEAIIGGTIILTAVIWHQFITMKAVR